MATSGNTPDGLRPMTGGGLPKPNRSPRQSPSGGDKVDKIHKTDAVNIDAQSQQMTVYDALSVMTPQNTGLHLNGSDDDDANGVNGPLPQSTSRDSSSNKTMIRLYPPQTQEMKDEESEISDLSFQSEKSGKSQNQQRIIRKAVSPVTETTDDDSSVEVEEYSDDDEGSSTTRSDIRSRVSRGRHQRALQSLWTEQKEDEWSGMKKVMIGITNKPLPESQSSVHSK